MTLEELTKALGLDTEDNKEKAGILKKEFNSKVKEVNTLNQQIETYKNGEESAKKNATNLEIVTKAFGLDFNAKDVDKMIEERKDAIVKEAGGGNTPEEFKEQKRTLTKTQRALDEANGTIATLTEQLNAEKTQRITTTKRNAIHKALVDNNAIKPDMFVDMFVDKVNVDDDGKTMTIKDDVGNDLSISDFITDWAKDNPELIKKDVNSGKGSGANGNGGNSADGGVSTFMQDLINRNKTTDSQHEGQSFSELFGA